MSRQKIAATRALATAIASQAINLHELEQQDDEIIRQELIKIKGIGNWTVDIYLMMSLRRPDAFPQSDLGVIIAYQKLKQLPNHPTPQQMSAVAKQWQPWRAVATRMLWHYYLNLTKPDTYAQAPQAFIP